MIPSAEALPRKSRFAALLDHFSQVEDPRDVRRILHPVPEVLLLAVCGTIRLRGTGASPWRRAFANAPPE
jgi:hypothetical protein